MRITALTYNISWASQNDVAAGSERDFVEMCQYTRVKCFLNSLRIINDIDNLHLIGLQEVNTTDIERKIIKRSKHLNAYSRGTIGLSSVSLIWNAHLFGARKHKRVINLKDGEDRPCLIIETQKGYQLIVAHFPWIDDDRKQLNIVYNIIRTQCFTHKRPTIVLADTNDEYTLISREHPFRLGRYELSQGMTRRQLKHTLISCCWHEKGHKFKSFASTGDYVLAPSGMMIRNYIPDLYKDILASDHRPVLADLRIQNING